MTEKSFQDHYPHDFAQCYGCGRLNEHGLQIKSHWCGENESVAYFRPQPYHTAVPGIVYGGLLASLVDCHCTGTAAAAMYKHQNRAFDSQPPLRFVTASLKVNYLKPTPLDCRLEIRGTVKEVKGRKVIIEAKVLANGVVTVTGEVVAVQIPADLLNN